MKKRFLLVISILVFGVIFIFLGIKLYSYLKIKYAKIEVELVHDLNLEFNDTKKFQIL